VQDLVVIIRSNYGTAGVQKYVSDDGDFLTCKGFRIDTVDGISAVADSTSGNLPSSIVQPKNHNHRYGDQSTLVKAMQKTLLGYLIAAECVLPGSVFVIPWICHTPPAPEIAAKPHERGCTMILKSEWYPDFPFAELMRSFSSLVVHSVSFSLRKSSQLKTLNGYSLLRK
jgi:hypothetical protein